MKANYKGLYQYLTEDYDKEIVFKDDRTIELDILRTEPENPFFKDEANINKLRRILRAFLRRNPSIGYIQGFNFIAGRILQVVEDEVPF